MAAEGTFFIKWNTARALPEMFTAEAKGLEIISSTGCFRVPKVVAVHEGTLFSCIIMEIINSGPRSADYWSKLAENMACMHQVTQPYYGLDHDNYIGSLPQYNTYKKEWLEFFVELRLEPQLKIAYDAGRLDQADQEKFDRFKQLLPGLLCIEKPALTHGDLWSGNLMIGEEGAPALIDPAVAYVHREMEIAFTRLFGGFDQEFYEVYQDIFPMEKGYMERFEIYNLYPLMVHLNLFGGGYYRQVMQSVSNFL